MAQRIITKPLVYMAHPVRPDKERGETIESNLSMAKQWLKKLTLKHPDLIIMAPWIPMCEVFDDADEEQRARGLEWCYQIVARCDQFWMVGPRVSGGMLKESRVAMNNELFVADFTGWNFPGGTEEA